MDTAIAVLLMAGYFAALGLGGWMVSRKFKQNGTLIEQGDNHGDNSRVPVREHPALVRGGS